MSDWLLFGIYFIILVIFIGVAELIRRTLHLSSEVTRKTVHILTGVLVATTPFIFSSKVPMAILAVLFICINGIGLKAELFPGMHDTNRVTYGTVFYPISFLVLLLLLWDHHKVVFVTSMLILAIADAAAAIVGENIARPHEFRLAAEKKSFEGSATMLITSFVITYAGIALLGFSDAFKIATGNALWIAAMVAIVATVCEAVSVQGSDNLTVPLGAAFVMHFMVTHSHTGQLTFSVGVGLATIIAVLSVKARFLNAGGAAVTFILAALIFGVGRWAFTVPILTFFILSSLLSRLGRVQKEKLAVQMFEKTGTRDLQQVFANGGIAGILLLLWYFFPDPVWYIVYTASLTAVTADTWSTEIGVLSKAMPRSILTFRRVPIGASGGVTAAGTLGGLLGGIVLVASAYLSQPSADGAVWRLPLLLLVILSGVMASMIDSLLGATVQVQYRCPRCDKITEKKIHCDGAVTHYYKGYKWINNDMVNIFCALSGVFITWLGMKLFL